MIGHLGSQNSLPGEWVSWLAVPSRTTGWSRVVPGRKVCCRQIWHSHSHVAIISMDIERGRPQSDHGPILELTFSNICASSSTSPLYPLQTSQQLRRWELKAAVSSLENKSSARLIKVPQWTKASWCKGQSPGSRCAPWSAHTRAWVRQTLPRTQQVQERLSRRRGTGSFSVAPLRRLKG